MSLQVGELKETIKEMSQKLKEVELCRHEASLTFVINDAKAFIESSEVRRSETFYCRGIGWYLTACTTRVNGQPESLSIYLNHECASKSYWSVETSFSISVLNATPGMIEKTKRLFYTRFELNSTKFGFRKFTSVAKLRNRGFLKNNQLKLRVDLNAKKLSRFNVF